MKKIIKENNIKKRRIFIGKTQREVANDLGIPLITYVLYENHKAYINTYKLFKIADYFGVSSNQLFDI
jgi:transcriptional regulator with XRE-family HTH domain